MRKWVKWIIGLVLLGLLLLGGIFLAFFNEPVPTGTSPEQADKIARNMLQALNYEAYQQTRYLEWTYRGGSNTYRWDKAMGEVEMTWGNYSGVINLVSPEKSSIEEGGIPVKETEKQKLIKEAIGNFNNDSFWLVAPFKIFDPGTKRGVVPLENGKKGLLVTYTQGGDTPGDTYVWELDDRSVPVSFRMWVAILPLKGLSATWEGWQKRQSGVLLPQYHKVGPITLDLGAVKATQ
jgi:hypothetical protein